MWKAGQIEEEHFHIAEQCMRDWLKIRAEPVNALGDYTVWRETDGAEQERKDRDKEQKSPQKKQSKSTDNPPPSPYTPGKWDTTFLGQGT